MKYTNNHLAEFGSFFIIVCLASSCATNDANPEDNEQTGGKAVPNSLHIAFETPDWNRQIDCSALDLYPIAANDEVAYEVASPETTRLIFALSYPTFSRALANSAVQVVCPAAVTTNPTAPL